MNKLKVYLQKMTRLSVAEANDIVDGMVNKKYFYDCDNILKTLKAAVSAESSSNREAIIFSTLNKINKQAEQTQPKSISKYSKSISKHSKSISKKELSNHGCPSHGKEPVDCSEKKDYIKQTLIFHPDKNPKCIEDATAKFQALQNKATCQFD